MRELVQHARKTFGNCHIKVITDNRIAEKYLDTTTYGADSVVDTTDINEIAAHFSLPDTFLIGTDSFWSWFSVGCQRRMGYTPKGIFLYTLADSDRYGVPGIRHVESRAIRWARRNSGFHLNGMIDYDEYQRYWAFGNTRSRGFPADIIAAQIRHIVSQDMATLKEGITQAA